MKPIALLDMDGTVADWDGAVRRDLAKMQGPNDPPIPEVMDTFHGLLKPRIDIIKSQPGWWRNLEPLPFGFHIKALLDTVGYNVQVLTKGPGKYPAAWGEKVEWCAKWLPGTMVNIVSDKSLFYGKVLVDDYPPYVLKWLTARPRGLVIMPWHPWNDEFEHDRCIHYDGSQESYDQVVIRAQEHYNK